MSKDTIQANEIIVGPKDGHHLTLSPYGIGLFDSNADLRARLRCHDGRTELTLYDANEQERASFSLRPDGSPAFKLCDGNGTERLGGTVLADGQPTLGFFDAMDGRRLELTFDGTTPNIAFLDQDGALLLDLNEESLFVADQQNVFATDADGNRVPWRSAKTPKKED